MVDKFGETPTPDDVASLDFVSVKSGRAHFMRGLEMFDSVTSIWLSDCQAMDGEELVSKIRKPELITFMVIDKCDIRDFRWLDAFENLSHVEIKYCLNTEVDALLGRGLE